MELGIELRQGLTLSPQLIQSIYMLRMNALELSDFLTESLDSNPFLERNETDEAHLREDFSAFVRDVTGHSGKNLSFDIPAPPGSTLIADLTDQLPPADSKVNRCARFLICNLDEDGYLDEDIADLVFSYGISEDVFRAALDIVQAMEPAGVGARSLSECLCLQLRRLGENGMALLIAENYLPELSKSHLNGIAKDLKISVKEVTAAAEIIRSLNPKPGSVYSIAPTHYISPDVAVVQTDGVFSVAVNDGRFPSLLINESYARELRSSPDADIQAYITERLNHARIIINGMERRASTLRSCAASIAGHQRDFFENGPGHMSPLTLNEVADDLAVHPSTVCRAIRGKYLQCQWGNIPMSAFFSRAVGGASAEKARTLIHELIQSEDKKRPLSDRKICLLLAEQGIDISRRTVAKYRLEMGILPSPGRKEY